MQKHVGIIGTVGKIPKTFQLKNQELLQATGMNTGNLVFQYAVYNAIYDERIIIGSELPWDPDKVRETCRVIVIPAANFVREGADFTSMANFLEKVDLPLVVLGLGAQADDYSKKSFELLPGTQRLLDIFKERCRTIGVRGPYSAEILEGMGVKNTAVIGCPSNFLNFDPNLPNILEKKFLQSSNVLSVTGDEPWPKSALKREAERKLITLIQQHGGVYILQSVEPFFKMMRALNSYQLPESDLEKLTLSLCNALTPEMSAEDFRKFAYSCFRIYFDVDQWLEDASRFDLSVGLRLHGNMVPFQAGTPAIWITHDARTQELAETMSLPRISLDDFLDAQDVQALKDAANPDFSAYATTRDILMRRYLEIFGENAIAHAHEVIQLQPV